MDALAPLPVAIPLFMAGLLAAGTFALPRRVVDALGVLAAASTAAAGGMLLARASPGAVHWFGGWTPRHGVAVGISFVVDPLSAGAVTLAATLVTASLLFSWRYFQTVGSLYHVLFLVFLGGMTGFALSGDLFTLFVFFELMGVGAYALTGYRIEERAPLQGALNFAITNSVGGFLILVGVGLVYGRTGALNMAQAGETLSRSPADPLVILAFVLLACGLLVKAAAVPFHFWLADAHAVAPTPVCVLFSGVMVQLGLYGLARVYWTVFSGTLTGHLLGDVLVWAGAATAVVGSVMCFEQRHLKRMLAFSTVGHSGVVLIAIGLLTTAGTAGGALYVLGHGLAKGALFLATGMVLHRRGSVDEDDLLGRGRALRASGLVYLLGGLALAGSPGFAASGGKDLIVHAADESGRGWAVWLIGFTSVLTGGAVLRAGMRVFRGWGRPEEGETPPEREEERGGRETRGSRGRTPAVMAVPALGLMLAGLALGLVPGLTQRIEAAAQPFGDRTAYAGLVLRGRSLPTAVPVPEAPSDPVVGLATTAGALTAALLALFRDRLPRLVMGPARVVRRPVAVLRAAHSGHVGDYVVWLTLGVALLGVALALGGT